MGRAPHGLPVMIVAALALVAPAQAGRVWREGSPVTGTATRTIVTATVTRTFTGTIFTETSTTIARTTSTTPPVLCHCPPTASTPITPVRVCHCPLIPAPKGYIAGRVVYGGHHRPADDWRVLIIARHYEPPVEVAEPRMYTSAAGAFSMRLAPGRYKIAAKRPNGKVCGARSVRVIDRKTAHVVLRCR